MILKITFRKFNMDNDFKWFMIAAAVGVVALFGGLTITSVAEENAKTKIVTACYQAKQPNCDKLYK